MVYLVMPLLGDYYLSGAQVLRFRTCAQAVLFLHQRGGKSRNVDAALAEASAANTIERGVSAFRTLADVKSHIQSICGPDCRPVWPTKWSSTTLVGVSLEWRQVLWRK